MALLALVILQSVYYNIVPARHTLDVINLNIRVSIRTPKQQKLYYSGTHIQPTNLIMQTFEPKHEHFQVNKILLCISNYLLEKLRLRVI